MAICPLLGLLGTVTGMIAVFDVMASAGMGIGVFESREYINELGGRLEVSSQPSRGTTFKVILPLYQRDALLERAA